MSGPLNSSAPTTSQIVGGVFNATTPTPADRQACAFQLDSEGNLLVRVVGGGAGVTELNGLTGNLNITGTGITVTPAGTNIVLSLPASGVTPTSYTNANITVNAAGIITAASNGSAGGVTSFIGRTGAVVAVSGDYTVAQVTGAAPIASPTFTGVPTGPTAAAGTNTTQLATTAFVLGQSFITAATAPVTSVFGRTGAVLAVSGDYTVAQVTGAAPIASPTFTGTATFDLTSSSVANIATFQQLGSQSGYVTLSAPLAFQTAISFNDNTNGADFLVYRPAGTQDLSIFSVTGGNQLYFAQAGGIYVGAATGGSKGAGTINVTGGYYVNGVLGSGTFSDSRLKTNIKPWTKGLDAILALKPVVYNWNEQGQKLHGTNKYIKKSRVGFIADDVHKVISESTRDTGSEWKDYDERAVIAALVNAVKELKSQNDLLRSTYPAVTTSMGQHSVLG
jgi:hypothetical protein